MARLNLDSIRLKIATQKGATDKILSKLDVIAQKKLDKEKKDLIETFLENPITQEIEEGPNASNISGTLNGKGNLWGFIGFKDGSTPIEDITEFLEKNITLDKRIQGRNSQGRFKSGGSNLLFDYVIKIPSKEDIVNITQLEWEPRSWLYGISEGLSGFNSFIYWKVAGRSTAGLQANNGRDKNGRFNGSGNPIKLRDGKFNNIKYWDAMYKTFKDSFK